jgi:two-component system response regulator MprA
MGTSENGNQARKIKIMLVEDEQPIVDFLTLGLNYEGFEVQSCLDGGLALGLAADFKPDLVVLDLMLPGMDGLEIARRLRAGSDLGIIILTAREDSQTTVKGLNLGADDYVIKPFDFPVLVARIRSVLRVELTNKEFELLEMLMDHPRQVFSRETILNRVWGYDFAGNTNVVDVYISYLRDKLEGKDESSRLIHTVRGVGYTFRPN